MVRGQYPRIPAHYGQDLADVIAALLQEGPKIFAGVDLGSWTGEPYGGKYH